MSSPITSVSAYQSPIFGRTLSTTSSEKDFLLSISVRGELFNLPREELTSLPESILLCLFPNGLLLEDQSDSNIQVDFDASALRYILEFFRKALEIAPPVPIQNPALVPGKAAIIVLKEDLDFYTIPPKNSPLVHITQLRTSAGHYLVSQSSIFEGLRKDDAENGQGSAEQHLIDMLCASGFNPADRWAKRYLEPQKACVTSIALALLQPSDSSTAMSTSQKLLLFWRKPARKCWWDATEPKSLEGVDGPVSGIKIWARRVWTLELSIIG